MVNSRKMKDTGIEWIGNIPENWQIIRVKDMYSFVTGFTPDTTHSEYYSDPEGYEWVTIADINKGKIANPTKSLISQEYVNVTHRSIVPPGCLLYSFKLSVGQTAISDRPLFTNEAIASFIPNNKINISFLKYSSSLIEYGSNVNIYGARILNQQLINNAYIVFPPIVEQEVIANYLDSRCNEIDALSSDIESQIEMLETYKRSVITEAVTKGLDKNAPMKDSGIEWVGKIPEHWEVDKVKHHLRRYEPRNPGNQEVLSVYREYGVIPKDSRDDNHNVTSEDTSKYKYVKPGNLVINKMKAWQGSMGVSEYEGIVSPAYFIYHFEDELVVPKYLHYLFRSCYKDEFRRISGGIREGQWDLSPEAFNNTLFLIPPVDEQYSIISYADSKVKEIESLINAKKEQLEVLTDYKKSLIYEYVTGKKEVPVA